MSDIAIVDPSQQVVTGVATGFTPRKRTVQIGSALVTGAAVMFFGGLFGIYVATRNRHLQLQDLLEANGESTTPWIPSGADVQLTAPTMMTWTLIISMVTMQWAVWCFKRNDRRHGLIALAVTGMFGAAVINQVAFQWNQLGLVIDEISSAAAPLIYTITASHVIMICVGLAWLLFAAFRALASSDTSVHTDQVASAAVWWYAMVGLYFIIWILIFITK